MAARLTTTVLAGQSNGTSTSSNYEFGVQLDNNDNGGIVTYWSNTIGGTKIYDVIAPLSGIKASTWYRFKAEITKLTADLGEDRCESCGAGCERQPDGDADHGQPGGHECVGDGTYAGCRLLHGNDDGPQLQELQSHRRERGQHLLSGGDIQPGYLHADLHGRGERNLDGRDDADGQPGRKRDGGHGSSRTPATTL